MPNSEASAHPESGSAYSSRRAVLVNQIRRLVRAIGEGDDATVQAALLELSNRRRIFASLGVVIGGFAMLFEGVKLSSPTGG